MKFVNPSSTYALGIIFPVLGLMSVVGRFMSRRLRQAGYSWDDFLAVIALTLTTGCGTIMIIGAATNTVGSHSVKQTAQQGFAKKPEQLVILQKLELAFFVLSILAVGFIRLVFLFFFRRTFRGSIFTIVNWSLIGLVCIWTLVFFIAYLSGCNSHIEAYWGSQKDLKSECVNTFALITGLCASDFIIDLFILILPLPCIWQLNTKRETKLGLAFIFLLGSFSVGLSCARMVFAIQILDYPFGTDTPLFGTAGTSDPVGVVSVLFWFGMLELGVGTITMNLPVLPGLLQDSKTADPTIQRGTSLRSISLASMNKGS